MPFYVKKPKPIVWTDEVAAGWGASVVRSAAYKAAQDARNKRLQAAFTLRSPERTGA